ncbi:MAG: glycine--tRNA ligase subunit beta [Planctomycetota bacterium]
MPELLLELATEELPARFLDRALAELAAKAQASLAEAALAAVRIEVAGTPRRLALWAEGIPEKQPDRVEEKVGPAKDSAYKDGKPTMAAQKFAESMGVAVEALETVEQTKKGKSREYLFARRAVPGREALALLGELIPTWIEAIPFQKSMRWVPGSKVRFGRPLRGICALFGAADRAEVVPTAWADVKSGRQVLGHRFLVPEPLELAGAGWDAYRKTLLEFKVVLDPAERRRRIEEGLRPHLGEDGLRRRAKLLAEVVNLVEWPEVDVGKFDPRFLTLPDVVVVEAMTGHQRYFPVRDAQGALQAEFAYVANRPLHPVIREGNERVLAARLSDALFFFEQDQKTPITMRLEALEPIVFMEGLGSYRDRIPRIQALALCAAKAAGWVDPKAALPQRSTGTQITRSFGKGGNTVVHIQLAAELARADLSTDVVGEFPELQGEIGAIYARLQGQADEVADAIREHYLPRNEGDDLPQSQVGICLALADKLDTIVSAWATGKKPTGSKDPFMVRRNALGVLRILRERQVDLGVEVLLDAALEGLPEKLRAAELRGEILAFFQDRLEVQATKGEGRDHLQARACLRAGKDPSNVLDFWLRLDALGELAQDARFYDLCKLVERTRTITQKNGADVDPHDVDVARLEHAAEKALHAALVACHDEVRTAIAERRYTDAGRRYVDALAAVTHTFFEPAPVGVFVMDEDLRLRTNRLALLKQIHALLADGFADLAEVGVEAK